MVIQVLHCRFCSSQNVIRHGKDQADCQRYLCHGCRRTFRERPGIGRNTLTDWLKKPTACRLLKSP